MYFVESAGGLGNQLFIWNLAHHLANKHKKKVVIIFPGKFKDRENQLKELKNFCNHNIVIFDHSIIGYLMKGKDWLSNRSSFLHFVFKRLFRILELSQPEQVASEDHLSAALVIRGFHQSSQLVQENFMLFCDELEQMTETVFERLLRERPDLKMCSDGNIIHIRRGDFENAYDVIGVLSLDYYAQIIQSEKFSKVTVISDAKFEKLHELQESLNIEILKVDGLSAWEDFSILCQGRKLVIANSTFSWWAAQFVMNTGSQVIAPKPWNTSPLFSKEYLYDSRFCYKEAIFQVK
jgi:hypothetical protein